MSNSNRSTDLARSTDGDNVVVINHRKSSSDWHRMLYSREEAARQLSISVRALDYYIASKLIQTRRKGRKVLIPHSELVRFASMNHYGPIAS